MNTDKEGKRAPRAFDSIDTETTSWLMEDGSAILCENGEPLASALTTEGQREFIALKPSRTGGLI